MAAMPPATTPAPSVAASQRLDQWLWAARFHKSRSLAAQEIERGRVQVNGQACKPARALRVGDTVQLRQGQCQRTLQVLGLSAVRGPAPVAQALYAETEASIQARQAAAEARRLAPEPALAIGHRHAGRPTKRDRRQLDDARQAPADWVRWSATWKP